ncbi:hypothetical protein BN1051_00279 [Arthrobacter saudimassiliensis]|uniref:Uncharacterized protein n=1 Tax=Arthrobacter saudimassiliensis TaxID=1461584 RepID=A0A078MQ52_9MICC|nr:hypothetical protein BN1051_00279 [Arthrobacter saudimassiliensis]
MAEKDKAPKESLTSRFMRTTGKARMIFGPAATTPLDTPMTDERRRQLEEAQARDAELWETVKRPDGSSYILPRKK